MRMPVVTFFLVSPAVFAADQEYINGAVDSQHLCLELVTRIPCSSRLLIPGYTDILLDILAWDR